MGAARGGRGGLGRRGTCRVCGGGGDVYAGGAEPSGWQLSVHLVALHSAWLHQSPTAPRYRRHAPGPYGNVHSHGVTLIPNKDS